MSLNKISNFRGEYFFSVTFMRLQLMLEVLYTKTVKPHFRHRNAEIRMKDSGLQK